MAENCVRDQSIEENKISASFDGYKSQVSISEKCQIKEDIHNGHPSAGQIISLPSIDAIAKGIWK